VKHQVCHKKEWRWRNVIGSRRVLMGINGGGRGKVDEGVGMEEVIWE